MADLGKHYKGVKRTALNFKGEDGKKKKKRRTEKDGEEPSSSAAKGDVESEEVPVIEGTGRIVTTTNTIHGFESKFKEELEVGDTVMIHHPVSLEVEMRVVTGILSQRSATVHSAFSKDVVSTMEYHIRKDSLKLQEKAKAQLEEGDDPETLQDAASKELQRQLDKKLKKQSRIVTVREKTGMWGYKVTSKKLSKEASAEDLLDERCKQGRDKYCW
mmetsp:Transcript_58821/g.102946  ORF Transcript_58821/g.102946 Transcript_58821/m.102946 type:complete len:216 (+) Transcript_58821:82-729(+)